MSTFVKECETCTVDGVHIVPDTLRVVRGLAGFWLVKAKTPSGLEVTVTWIGSSETAEKIVYNIARLAREKTGRDLAIINSKVEFKLKDQRMRRRSAKGGAA